MELIKIDDKGKSSGHVKVSEDIFSVPQNEHVVQSALDWYLASKRRGTHSAKTRAEVSGGGKKPWKQKGTGRARQGSTRAPHWRGGGVVFAPKPRDYGYALPKKVRKLALKVLLSSKARSGKIKVLDDIKVASPKTKEMVGLLKGIGVSGKAILVADKGDKNLVLSSRNIKGLKLTPAAELNVHDLIQADWIVFTKDSVSKVEEALK